ncbi:hypothetical protein BDV95DRAFT_634220 [Massariosphaeria phaeospora]|uniref:Uncharacterized protein n=1 Tax=Massariosphaeria phaeospora TaxID=100035 RepID=A0A7C8IK06_9PLEO|nr:hypothetical protein BDV95DRAFT_634220 [Massariosphaeria phaeospora]
MGRSSLPPALQELANPSSPEAQVQALRSLKNEIVGHDQRKELAVKHGVVKPLAGLLRTEARKGGKRRRGATNGHGGVARDSNSERAPEWTADDELRFQATLVVGSLANGGAAFVAPLRAGDVLPPLLDALSPSENPPKLVVAALRALTQLVDAVAHEKPWQGVADHAPRSSLLAAIHDDLYARPVIESLAAILAQPARAAAVHQQIPLATKLITATCQEERQRTLLVNAGLLDILASKMAAIAAADEESQRTGSTSASREELPLACLPDILEAISAIIRDSHYNTARFLYSQPVQQLFGTPKSGTTTTTFDGHSQTRSWDSLLPRLQTVQSKPDNYTKSWPALGSFNSSGTADSYSRLPSTESLQPSSSRAVITDESESPLFTWLMFVARRGEGRERLSACWLLALLKKFGERWPLNDPSKMTRERHFSYLIIPLLVKMIQEANPTSEQSKKLSSLSPQALEEHKFVLERSPLVLAELVGGNRTLQNATVDARILPVLVQILKKSFDPVASSSKPQWQPRPTSPQVRDPLVDPASSTLGRPGLSRELLHAFRYRESALLALAAMADSQDNLRKVIIELNAANYIIDSLVPYPESSRELASSQSANATTTKDGNPASVLIAACKVTRSLSRSISVLRTSLIDHGIAQPSFDLLTHPNVNVQIAATEVITNLVLEVSPMRTEIIEAGALKTLCEHCRSANFELRYGSLWALKHLCLGLPYSMKIHCLEELGIGWLIQTLNGDSKQITPSATLGMGTPNAAGEQVDILNAVDDPHMDVDEEASSEEDEDTMTDDIPSMRRHQRPGSRYTSATNIRDRLHQIKTDEHDTRLNTERDDIRIQEQALDFLRNFITEDKASGEMIDHLLNSFTHTRFFELLDAKLRPKGPLSSSSSTTAPNTTTYWPPSPAPFSNTSTSTSTSSPSHPWPLYPPTELLTSTLYILVHLANGRPTHRSLVVAQTTLMTHILPLLSHPRREVRLPCAWFLNNLVYVEDAADEPHTRDRALKLRALGFDDGARALGRDVDLDIRERAKTAMEQMGKLLGVGAYTNPVTGPGTGPPFGAQMQGGGGAGAGGQGDAARLAGMGSQLGGLQGHRGWGSSAGRDGGV